MKKKSTLVLTSLDVVQRHLVQEILKGVIENSSLRDSDSSVLSQTVKKDKIIEAQTKLKKIRDVCVNEDFQATEVTYVRPMDSTPKLEWKNQHLTLSKSVEIILHTMRMEERSFRMKKYCLILVKPKRSLFKWNIGQIKSASSASSDAALFDYVYDSEPNSKGLKTKSSKSEMREYDNFVAENLLAYIEPGLPILANHVRSLNGIVMTFDHRNERNVWLNELTTLLNTVPLDTAHLLDLPSTSSRHVSRTSGSISPQKTNTNYKYSHSSSAHHSSPRATSNPFITSPQLKDDYDHQDYYSYNTPSSPALFNDRKYAHTLFEDLRKVSPHNHGSFMAM